MSDDRRKRIYKLLAFLLVAVVLLWAYAIVVRFTGHGIRCVFKSRLGIECSACGLSRAAASLLTLDFVSAFSYNAIWPLYLCYGIWIAASASIRYLKYGESVSLPKPLWLNFVVLGVMLAYGVLRNFV